MTNVVSVFKISPLGSLDSYICLVNSFPCLSVEKEYSLINKFYYTGDLESVKQLILSHLRFVVHIAKHYSGYGLPQADLIQEGNIGLMKAIRKFNPSFKVRLISFAIHWIKAEIHEYVLKNWRIVKIATTKAQRKLFFNLRRIKKKIGWFNNKEVSVVACKLCVTRRDVQEMESRMSAQDVTFDLPLGYDNFYKKSFVLPLEDKCSNFSVYFEESDWKKFFLKKLTKALKLLDNRSKYIIHSRWLYHDKKITLRELANYYGISAERVRQLEKKAIKRLRIILQSNLLDN